MVRQVFGNRCVIFDIDGVLADCSHRVHFLEQPKRDWEGFLSAVSDDDPILHNIWLLECLHACGVQIALVTGRAERTRRDTQEWMMRNLIKGDYDILFMRADGDYRIDFEVKREMLQGLRKLGCDVFMAFDDSQRVVDMYIEEGVPCHFVRAPDANKNAQVKNDAEKQTVDDGRNDSQAAEGNTEASSQAET